MHMTDFLTCSIIFIYTEERRSTMWTKPTATEMRFGFEVTMYVMNK